MRGVFLMKIFKKEKKEQLDSKVYELYYMEHLLEIWNKLPLVSKAEVYGFAKGMLENHSKKKWGL